MVFNNGIHSDCNAVQYLELTMEEKAISLKEVAERLGVSYRTIFDRRTELGFRIPGSRVWRVWPSTLADFSRPRKSCTIG